MKKVLTAALALSMLASAGVAAAQPGPPRPGDRHEQRHDRYEQRAERSFKAGPYKPPRSYKAKQWRRGERLPASYRTKAYVIDHRRYGLVAPPRGHQYVRVGNDAVLVASGTGVISSVIIQLFR